METTKRYNAAISQRNNMLFQVHDIGASRSVADYIPSEKTAKIFSESLNIHSETGLTPRQLLEQRDDMIKAFQLYLKHMTSLSEDISEDHVYKTVIHTLKKHHVI